jgi:hypothetical protein
MTLHRVSRTLLPGSMFELIVVPEPSAVFVVGVAIAAIARFSRRAASRES